MPIEEKQLIISYKTHSSYALHTSTHTQIQTTRLYTTSEAQGSVQNILDVTLISFGIYSLSSCFSAGKFRAECHVLSKNTGKKMGEPGSADTLCPDIDPKREGTGAGQLALTFSSVHSSSSHLWPPGSTCLWGNSTLRKGKQKRKAFRRMEKE